MNNVTIHKTTGIGPSTSILNWRHYCYRKLAAASRPRDRLTVSMWADRHRWLSSKQSGEPGPWRTSRNPMLREIMDCFSAHANVADLTVMKSSQVGITEAVVNAIGYTVEHDPCPAMVLMPTLESRDSWKAQKLNPLFTDTEAVRNVLGGNRSRDAANRQDMIDFPGGILFLAGGNSPNSYAQKSVRRLVMDDLDRFPEEIGDEGDPVALGQGRLKAFTRSLFAKISTPTVKGASLIEREYEASDQRRYHVPCPNCAALQVLRWENLQYSKPVLTSAWYECEHCGFEIQEHHKPAMLREYGHGGNARWIAAHPDVKRRGYHISALYASIGLGPSWLDLAREWVFAQEQVKNGDTGPLCTFTNTQLGETWRIEINKITPHELEKRMEDVPPRTIPVGCLAITVAIDTQDKWLAVQLLGWGAHHLWVLEYHEINGDTLLDETWDRLQEYLNTPLTNAFGRTMRIRAAGVDSRGHRGEQVRKFVSRTTLKIPVYAIQGSTMRINRPIALTASTPDKNWKGKTLRGGYGLWNVGTEHCKDHLLGQLVADTEKAVEDHYIRFCNGLDTSYFNGLLSEYKDPVKKRYVQKKGAQHRRNEPLDTLVYAWAIGNHREVLLGKTRFGRVDAHYWTRLEALLEAPADAEGTPPPAPPSPASRLRQGAPPKRGGFVNRWKR
jgi:phage terminase large subunit GpA-like protein